MPNIGAMVLKDSADELLYVVDWTAFLAGVETIATSTWAISGPDTVLVSSNPVILAGNLKTQVMLEAGTAGKTYTVTNTITLTGSPVQTVDRSFRVRVTER